MKKTLSAMVTSALVIGAASTTFAAANPFSDVPADHWSYDAVVELAQAGIIEGYGDGSFRGDRAITRYEMAQMIAKAMTKDVNGDAKATLDKLAAEYADELNNLGVRVDALEKKVDNVKFDGRLRLRYRDDSADGFGSLAQPRSTAMLIPGGLPFPGWPTNDTLLIRKNRDSDKHDKQYTGNLQLNITAKVTDEWQVKSRAELEYDFDDNVRSNGLKTAYAQGPLFGATAKLGMFEYTPADELIWSDYAKGASFEWETGAMDIRLAGGRLSDDSDIVDGGNTDFASLELGYDFNDKFGMSAGYYQFKDTHLSVDYLTELSPSQFISGFRALSDMGDETESKIWSIGAKYAFNDNLALSGTYAKSDLDVNKDFTDDDAYKINLQYKGAELSDPGSFGVNLGYYRLGAPVALDPGGDVLINTKGWRLGAEYTIAENILWSGHYYKAEALDWLSEDVSRFQTEVQFFF